MPQFFFDPSARLQKFLGNQLISDPNLAVAEFVKNSYDAGATQVYADFAIEGRSKESQSLTLSDNGIGMDRDSFQENWMRPGYSYKAVGSPAVAPKRDTPAEIIRASRVPIGEKGLGRLAAARLGDLLDVYTRETPEQPWLHVVFDWTAFDDMERPLTKVPVDYDFETPPSEPRFASGTIVQVRRLTLDWAGQVPGRRVWWRPNFRLGRLKQDLGILIAPLPTSTDFIVDLACDSGRLQQFTGPLKAGEPETGDYEYTFSISETDTDIVIERSLRRSPDIAAKLNVELETRSTVRRSRDDYGEADGRPDTLRCGTFKGVLVYSPLTGKRRAEFGRPPGVFLYRDVMRIDPYGHGEDDWLGARAKKASRQGYAAIQPKFLFGFIEISRADNPGLVDMSNRQGLVENDEYEDFIAHARAEFRAFETLIFKEYVEPQWEQPESKIRKQAELTQAFGVALTRALMHSIGQPVAGLDAEMATLRRVADSSEIPPTISEKLHGIEKRVMGHLDTIRGIVRAATGMDEEDYSNAEAVQLNRIVQEAVGMTEPLASSLKVAVQFLPGAEQKVILPRRALFEAIAELLRNAIEAERPPVRADKWVTVETAHQARLSQILISDNGSGFDRDIQDDVGTKAFSTKGRPGVGLIRVRELLALCNASFRIAESSTEGTTFEVRIQPGVR